MSKVCIAKILTAHGVRGLVKLDCFLEDPSEFESYNPLVAADGRSFTLRLKNSIKGKYLAEIEGVTDRTEAEKYRNIELFISRDQLPDAEDGFYHEDLVGLDIQNSAGVKLGKVIAVENFGAGDLIQIQPLTGKIFYLPFTEPYVVETDIDNKRMVVDRIEEFQE